MFRRTVLSMIVLFLAFGAAIVYPHPLLSYAQSDGCASADYSTALHLLADSQTALNDSDVAQSVQLEAQARAELRRIFQDCAVTPMLHNMGFGQATIDEVAQMPFCEYRFEATVRSGPDAGLALNGTLALMQNSDTAAVGYVYSLDQTATAVPVLAELGDQNAVTLTFTLAADQSIIGTGYLTANINSCFGGIEGVLTGPTSGDVGDWIGIPARSIRAARAARPAYRSIRASFPFFSRRIPRTQRSRHQICVRLSEMLRVKQRAARISNAVSPARWSEKPAHE